MLLCNAVLYYPALYSTAVLIILQRTENMIMQFADGLQLESTDWLRQWAETNLMKLNSIIIMSCMRCIKTIVI